MKKFEFSLQKMQRYKQQILDREKNLLGALQGKKNKIQNDIEYLEHYLVTSAHDFEQKQKKGVSAVEIMGHGYLMQNTRMRLKQLHVDLIEAEKEVEQQRKIVLVASQEMRSIDKLEEKQLEEYQLETVRAQNEETLEMLVMQTY